MTDPRVARSRAKILESTVLELAEHGWLGLTIEGVAARAGVGKSTVYRHWSSRQQLVVDAVREVRAPHLEVDTGSLRDDVLAILTVIAGLMDERPSLLPTLIDAAERDAELATLHQELVRERRQPLLLALRRAIARGELPPEVDLELAADLVAGPAFYRRFASRGEVTPAFLANIVDALLPALCRGQGG